MGHATASPTFRRVLSKATMEQVRARKQLVRVQQVKERANNIWIERQVDVEGMKWAIAEANMMAGLTAIAVAKAKAKAQRI